MLVWKFFLKKRLRSDWIELAALVPCLGSPYFLIRVKHHERVLDCMVPGQSMTQVLQECLASPIQYLAYRHSSCGLVVPQSPPTAQHQRSEYFSKAVLHPKS